MKDITKTESWKTAESEYGQLMVSGRMPLFGEPLSKKAEDRRMAEILERCPQFYPSLLHRGIYFDSLGETEKADSFLDRGFELMIELLHGEELKDAVHQLVVSLEDRTRYDTCCRYLATLVDLHPKEALYYDYWACSESHRRNGSMEKAKELQRKAVQLEPENPTFLSNLSWIHLEAGELRDAEKALEKALSIDPEHGFSRANTKVLDYLKGQTEAATIDDFLLRRVDYRELQKLEDDDNWEELDPIVDGYNRCRMEAFENALVDEGDLSPYQIWNYKTTLRLFFQFTDKALSEYFLFEDVTTLSIYFKPIMHKFIVRHSDVDDEIIDDICASLALFYSFLSRCEILLDGECEEFLREIESMKPELKRKMHRYNEIRHDECMSDEKKEEIRCELFEGDHWIPL